MRFGIVVWNLTIFSRKNRVFQNHRNQSPVLLRLSLDQLEYISQVCAI